MERGNFSKVECLPYYGARSKGIFYVLYTRPRCFSYDYQIWHDDPFLGIFMGQSPPTHHGRASAVLQVPAAQRGLTANAE